MCWRKNTESQIDLKMKYTESFDWLILCTKYTFNWNIQIRPDALHLLFLSKHAHCNLFFRIYGFYDECKRRYNIKLWKTFTDCFNCLPIGNDNLEDMCIVVHYRTIELQGWTKKCYLNLVHSDLLPFHLLLLLYSTQWSCRGIMFLTSSAVSPSSVSRLFFQMLADIDMIFGI